MLLLFQFLICFLKQNYILQMPTFVYLCSYTCSCFMGFRYTLQTSKVSLVPQAPLIFSPLQSLQGDQATVLMAYALTVARPTLSFVHFATWLSGRYPYHHVVLCYTIYDVQHHLHPQNIRHCADHLRPHYH